MSLAYVLCSVNPVRRLTQVKLIEEISEHLGASESLGGPIERAEKANTKVEARDKAIAYCDTVKPYLDKVRYHVE